MVLMLKALSAAGYLAMVAGLAGLLATKSLFSLSPLVIAPQLLAIALVVWARVTFGRRSFHVVANPTEGGLVTSGPYRFIRHPIYAGVCLFATASVLAHLSWTSVLWGGLIWAGIFIRIVCEERLVVIKYPEYSQYAAKTARIVPFLF